MQFLSALAAIVVIDLVLAGDNAIVIALAARSLQGHLRRRAIVWGTVGAIAVRTAMTLIVVWLLTVPGLLGIGGGLLVGIAYKLLLNKQSDQEHRLQPAKTFWAAMMTIVVADALMGLDNVLAVAGAAQGSFMLVVLGLLISVPIMIWGSQLILKYVDRHPVIIYFGAGVLAWTAAKMLMSEPLLDAFIPDSNVLVVLLYVIVIGGVLGAGFLTNHRKVHSRIAAHVAATSAKTVAASPVVLTSRGETAMKKVLLPVDGSQNSLRAVRHAANRFLSTRDVEVHLLHVRHPFSQHIARFVTQRDRVAYHREQAQRALAPASELLARFGVPHLDHVELGERAETIVGVARRIGASEIIMGTARKNSLTRILEDSVTYEVLESSPVPVEIVAGTAVSPLERYGVPAGVGAIVAFVLFAVD